MKIHKAHLANFTIAGFTYYEGVDCWEQLAVGKTVTLQLDSENKYDPRAIAVYFEQFKLGYVPRQENRIFYKLLSMGYTEIISAKIQKKDENAHPEAQIQVVAFLLENKNL